MTTMRIALDTGPLHGHRTGVGVAAEEFLAGLTAHRATTPVPYVVSFRARLRPDERRLGLPAALTSRLWAVADRPSTDRWFRDVDLIHGTNYCVAPSRLPTVVSVYDCWFLANPDSASPPVARAGQALRRAAARGAMIHVSSQATAAAARHHLGTDRVEVIHLGPPATGTDPDPDRSAPGAALPVAPGVPFIVSIATIERRKSIPTLIDAFALLAADQRSLHLVVAGANGDDGAQVAQRLAALPREVVSRIHLMGPVDAATKHELLSRATVLAYPSLDEGFGFPILEAQRYSLAVVGTRAGSIPEVGGAGVELCAPGDPDDLARALDLTVRDDAHRRDLIAAGVRNLERFSWQRSVDELVQLYRRVIDQHDSEPNRRRARR